MRAGGLFRRVARSDRSGQQLSTLGLVAMVMFSLFLWIAHEIVEGINERAEEQRAHLAVSRQFARVEQSVFGSAVGSEIVLDTNARVEKADAFGMPTGVTHFGWDDSQSSAWSPWHAAPGELCDMEAVDACWQFRFGEIDSVTIRAGIIREERNVFVRTIAGCNRLGLAPNLSPLGIREPEAQATILELTEHCVNVSNSETRYRKRSFTDYGIHIAVQESSPRQGSEEVAFDPTLVLSSPIHTNQERFIICGWPEFGPSAEVSTDVLASRTELPLPDPADGIRESDSACNSGNAPAGTQIYRSGPLEVSLNATSDAAAARCDQTIPTGLLWMADAHELAINIAAEVGGGFFGVIPAGGTIDLATLPTVKSEHVIYGVADMTVIGQAPLGISVSVVAAGDIVVEPIAAGASSVARLNHSAEWAFGAADGSDNVVTLVAGCDVRIIDPAAALVSASNHDVFLSRTAILAPSGALFPDAYQSASDSNPPRIILEGSVASGYWGNFGSYDAAGNQLTGYGFDLDHPFGWSEIVPPWWPDPLGGAWEPVQ